MNRDIPTDPATAYKRIIDSLVEMTPSPAERLIIEEGLFTKQHGKDAEYFNALVRSLSPDQRAVLARICTAERKHAIHGALDEMMWWVHCAGLELTYNGVPMPVLRCEGMNGDYIGRVDGWQWPTFDRT